jgi:vitamin B12 transporter
MKKSLPKLIFLSLVTASISSLCLPVQAAPQMAKPQTLQVSQTKSSVKKVPASTIILTAADLERGHYRSIVDALEDCPGISISRTGYGDGEQRILINGEDRVLVLMDGRKLNVNMGVYNGNGGFDASTIPDPELIEKVEILKGSAGSLYGSGAVGGVINIVTKRATSDYVKLDGAMGQLQTYKYNGILSAKRGKYGLLITGGTYHQKDMRYKDAGTDKTETLGDSKWELDSFGVKLDREIGTDKLITLHYQHSFKEGRIPGGVSWMTPYYHADNQLERLNNAMSARYDWNKDKDNAGFFNLYHTYYTDRIWLTDNAGNVNKYVSNESTNGFDAQQKLALSAKNNLAIGASWRHSALDSDLFASSDKEAIDNKALYLSDTWDFTPTLALTSGVRYDHYNTFGSKTTYSVGLAKQLDASSRIYANWGTFFNAPSGGMLYADAALPNMTFKGNADLSAETGNTWSLGYDKEFGKNTDLSLSYFHSFLKDALAWSGIGSNTYQAVNADKETKYGYTIAAKHKFSDKWSTRLSYTYTHINYDDLTNFDLLNYPHQYKLSFDYTMPKFRAELAARAGSGADANYYTDKSYLTMDLAMDYKFNKDWQMYGRIYNLTNAAYAEQSGTYNGSSLYPMPSRYFVLGVQYLF